MGDCHPEKCGPLGIACEASYVRFWDEEAQVDRTMRSCRCLQVNRVFENCRNANFFTNQKPLCRLLVETGCLNYTSLKNDAQSLVRKWTTNEAERHQKMNHLVLMGKNKLMRNATSGNRQEKSL